jgi:hypothetical protein
VNASTGLRNPRKQNPVATIIHDNTVIIQLITFRRRT